MRQSVAYLQRLFGAVQDVRGYHPRGSLFENPLLSIPHYGAQHIVAGD